MCPVWTGAYMEHETGFEPATHTCPKGKRSYSLLANRSQLPLPLAKYCDR